MNVRQIAKIAHEINRAYRASMNERGDNPSWDDFSEDQRESTIRGVKAHLQNPSLTPEQSHELWAKDKLDQGWKYGKTKDIAAKTHPCLVPYEELPQEQRSKDYLFKAVITQLAPFVSLGVRDREEPEYAPMAQPIPDPTTAEAVDDAAKPGGTEAADPQEVAKPDVSE